MNMDEKKRADEKKEWTAPTLTVLVVDSATNGPPNGNAANDGFYS